MIVVRFVSAVAHPGLYAKGIKSFERLLALRTLSATRNFDQLLNFPNNSLARVSSLACLLGLVGSRVG